MAGMIGVLGGTFDPPHLGHVALAEAAYVSLKLERVLWVVTADPPHKPDTPLTPVEDRLAMVQAAIQASPIFEISRVDIDRPAPHYALDTVKILQAQYPGKRLAYLIGSDSLRDLPKWHEPKRFMDTCDLLGVLQRPGADPDLEQLEEILPGIIAKLEIFPAPVVDISAHDIRRRVRLGEPYSHLVPTGVAEIINTRSLYQ
jgi:nicotinate-nucleotide adenylyltransferase